jgi:hypothetical protein
LSVANDGSVNTAASIADSLRSFAIEYQELVRSTEAHYDSDEFEKSKRRLNKHFVALKARSTVDDLQNSGHVEAAERLDGLVKTVAMVFNLVDVSIGVEETEILDIDVETPYEDAIRALKELRKL